MKKIIIFIVCFAIILFALPYFYTQDSRTAASILLDAKTSIPNVKWDNPEKDTYQSPAGVIKGTQLTGTTTSNQAYMKHFENKAALEKLGYKPDQGLSADGPGSSSWGYKKTDKGITTYIIYSYKTIPTEDHPNEPLQFNCPCQMDVSVFVSDPIKATGNVGTTLANPASVNCTKVGGTNLIMNGPNGQYGLCDFGDNMQCEEWALFRGQCPVGGVKTTGYDTIEEKYCAWVGGETLAELGSDCTLPNGTVCSNEDLYDGSCSTE